MGGKVKIRKKLVSLFPERPSRVIDLFCGPGNVAFEYINRLYHEADTWDYCREFRLNDKYCGFLQACKNVNSAAFPGIEQLVIDRNLFKQLKLEYESAPNGTIISQLIQPFITYGGKGYKAGYRGNHTLTGKKIAQTIKNIKYKYLEFSPKIGCFIEDWKDVLGNLLYSLTKDDFVYIDPPYITYNTKSGYPPINHKELLNVLLTLPCKWALSGYDSQLYQDVLINTNYGFPVNKIFIANKSNAIANSITNKSNKSKSNNMEYLWTNYQ